MPVIKSILRLLKKVYNNIPFKKHLFVLIRHLYIPPQRIYAYMYFKGWFRVNIDNDHSFKIRHYGSGFTVENDLFWSGISEGWEKQSIELWIKLCAKKQVIIDIGANTGIYSLIAKTLNPNSDVFAFEPVKRVYNKLEENNKLNNYNIVCVPWAASNYNGSATIYDPGGQHVYSVTVNENLNTKYKTKKVAIQTTTIDTFIENNNLTSLGLLKIDVETHEPEVLEGISKHLTLFSPTILIEVLKDEIGEKIETILNKLGCNYLYFNLDETGGIRRVDRILKSDYYNYLLCTKEIAEKLNLLQK